MKPQVARTLVVAAIVAVSIYLLHGLLGAIAWACLIAVSTWPLRERLQRAIGNGHPAIASSVMTAAVVVLLLVPISVVVYEAIRETPALLRIWSSSRSDGIPPPDWLAALPLAGEWLTKQWAALIGEPGALPDVVHDLARGLTLQTGRAFLAEAGGRAMSLFFCIVVLFFVYLNGNSLAAQTRVLLDRQFGPVGMHTMTLAVGTVRGTVNGLVLVGLAVSIVMSVAYLIGGVPHPFIWGLLTGLLGMVPFGAVVVLAGVVLYLFATGATTAALVLVAFGATLIFVTDHFIRPAFIAGSSRLPLVLALLGVIGGLERFGVMGIFIGPALLAVMSAVWRELTEHRAEIAEEELLADPSTGSRSIGAASMVDIVK